MIKLVLGANIGMILAIPVIYLFGWLIEKFDNLFHKIFK